MSENSSQDLTPVEETTELLDSAVMRENSDFSEQDVVVPNDETLERTETDGEAESDSTYSSDLRGVVEALIFASDEPISFKQVRIILEQGTEADLEETAEGEVDDEQTGEATEDVSKPLTMADLRNTSRSRKRSGGLTLNHFRRAVEELNAEYMTTGRAFRIVEIAGGYVFQTVSEYGEHVGRLYAERTRRRLSQSALETLAIIAFKQPISKPAIEGIRGVNADFVLKSLLEKNLIAIVGREDTVGRPLLYGTTTLFLKHFGLRSLDDMPKMREIQELFQNEGGPITHSIEEAAEDGEEFINRKLNSLFDTMKRNGEEQTAEASAEDAALPDDSVETMVEEHAEDSDSAEVDIDNATSDKDGEADESPETEQEEAGNGA